MGLTSCCGCGDLRGGTVAIGFVYVVLSMLGILFSAIVLVLGPEILIRSSLPKDLDNPQLTDVHVKVTAAIVTVLRIQLWVTLVFSVVTLLVNAVLILMIDNTCMALTWLIVQGILLVLGTLGFIYQLIAVFSSGSAVAITVALIAASLIALQWYWYAVVRAYYQMMKMVGRVQPTSP